MRKLMILILLTGFADLSLAQTFEEWFRQKKTQKKYLIEQIAQLKIYLELIKKGYEVAKEGLTAIGDIKNGEFKLHKNYFDSLKVVNPSVAGSEKVKWIGMLHSETKSVCSNCISSLSRSEFLTSDELVYLRAVFGRLNSDCDNVSISLDQLLENGSYAMTDDQRLKRVEDLYDQMLFNYTFSKAFCNESAVLAAARMKQKEDVATSRAMHGIK